MAIDDHTSPLLPSGRSPDREDVVPAIVPRPFRIARRSARGTTQRGRNCPAWYMLSPSLGRRALQRASSQRRPAAPNRQKPKLSTNARRCRAKFLEYFPAAFHDADYLASERAYKWDAHRRWEDVLGPDTFRGLLAAERYQEIAAQAVSIEARTNLLFSFEKMALRDAVKSSAGAQTFAQGLYDFLHGDREAETRLISGATSSARCRGGNSRPHLAGADRFWLHRSAACALVPQANSDAARGPRIRLRLSVSLEAFVGNVQEPAWLRSNYRARDTRSASARYDGHPVFHLGARFGRISRLVAVTKSHHMSEVLSPRSRARTHRSGCWRFRKANTWLCKGSAEIHSSHTGIGIEGDAHAGSHEKHLWSRKRQPTQPNLRQIHLIASELLDELKSSGFDISPATLAKTSQRATSISQHCLSQHCSDWG